MQSVSTKFAFSQKRVLALWQNLLANDLTSAKNRFCNMRVTKSSSMKQPAHRNEGGPARSEIVGRAAQANPPNRFERLRLVSELDDADGGTKPSRVPTEFIPDASKTVVTENDSPDLDFRFSLNPYRGCEHGCSYCYARTYHEYLGFSGGLDFETKIVYKPDVAEHLRRWLSRPSWRCEHIALSGATDCYQPAERKFELTRACLQVALDFRQPISIVTKNALVLRDIDILSELAQRRLVRVSLSVTSLDQQLTKILEPRSSSPVARLRTMEELVAAGVPTCALLSPIIPGLNDSEIPKLLEAVANTGVKFAGSTLLRLPGVVQEVFMQWLKDSLPEEASRIESRIRQTRGAALHDAQFGKRMRGEGEMAKQIRQTFAVFSKRFGMTHEWPPLNTDDFRRPNDLQKRLF